MKMTKQFILKPRLQPKETSGLVMEELEDYTWVYITCKSKKSLGKLPQNKPGKDPASQGVENSMRWSRWTAPLPTFHLMLSNIL